MLAPAGNIEKLETAFAYGADAAYVGGTVFGLRKYADNFSESQLRQAVNLANRLNKKVFLVLNGFAHNSDLESLIPHLELMEDIRPHAFIISDMGVLQLAKRHTSIPVHVSTQASVTNVHTCRFWQDAGAERIILAREVSVEDCRRIKAELDVELEVFIHGAMCASYSGKCVISNYTSGRDSNRGGCVQSCRHRYDITPRGDSAEERGTYSAHIMNAKDLASVHMIPELIDAGIDSLKIEGRMKSNMYVANAVKVYREAIDACLDGSWNDALITRWAEQLSSVSNRGFSTGGLAHRPFAESIHYEFTDYDRSAEYVGVVKDILPEQGVFVEVRFGFENGDTLELFRADGERLRFTVAGLADMAGNTITQAKPSTVVRLPWLPAAPARRLDILRKPIIT